MSNKGTILCTPWCHIYESVIFESDKSTKVLCIDVDYGQTSDEESSIEVDFYSDFSVMLRVLIERSNLSSSELIAMVREINKEAI